MEYKGLGRYQKYLKLLRDIWQKREDVQLYLGLLLTLTAISFFVWFAIRPTLATILELVRQIDGQKQTLAQLEKKAAALSQAQREWQRIENYIDLVNQAIPDGALPEITARQIEALAGEENLALVNLSVGKIKILGTMQEEQTKIDLPKNVRSFPISFTVQGAPERIFSFLSRISQVRRPIIWESISVSGKPPEAATNLSLTISSSFPYIKQ